MEFPAGYKPVQGEYTVEQRDNLFKRISAYPDPATAADGDTPVFRDGVVSWEPQSGGSGGSPGVTFTVTLTAEDWANGAQTVSDERFLASGYAYIYAPASSGYAAYATAQVYAEDVLTDGAMVFHAVTTPTVALLVNILRQEADEDE